MKVIVTVWLGAIHYKLRYLLYNLHFQVIHLINIYEKLNFKTNITNGKFPLYLFIIKMCHE